MRRALCCLGFIWLALHTAACSAVRYQWRDASYLPGAPQPCVLPKRLAIVGWSSAALGGAQVEPADAHRPRLAELLARVAGDFIKLRRNYLVYETSVVKKSFAEGCRGKVQGVLMVRALNGRSREDGRVDLDLSVEMYACSDGALVWRVEGASQSPSRLADLAQLTDSYADELGEPSRAFVAPSFSLLQDLFGTLPDVALTDDEIGEKIELGMNRSEQTVLARAPGF